MKINDVRVNNWNAPGEKWWKSVKECPSEPLIEATMTMTLSWSEYRELLDKDQRTAAPNQRI